ncbi:MAG: hypothetical protein PHS37_03905 [Candidatus Omnitrophica bacterium]|nr:hypothetical protein [Candidatus Omnitrophota bacterium]
MRINIFANMSLQFKYLVIIIAAMVLPAVVVGGALYYFIFTFAAEQIGNPDAIAANLIPVLERVNLLIAGLVIPLCALLVWWGLALSHRFYGPIERIKADLDSIVKGDYNVRFRVRKSDDIHDIVEMMNKILDVLASKKKDR